MGDRREADEGKHPKVLARELATKRGVPLGMAGIGMTVYAYLHHIDMMIYVGAAAIALATKMVTFRQLGTLVPWGKKDSNGDDE